jgi:hypothetical protein
MIHEKVNAFACAFYVPNRHPEISLHKVHLLYEREYVMSCAGNLTEGKSSVCLNFPLAY